MPSNSYTNLPLFDENINQSSYKLFTQDQLYLLINEAQVV